MRLRLSIRTALFLGLIAIHATSRGEDTTANAVQNALNLQVLSSGVDQDGNSFLAMRLTYSRDKTKTAALPERIVLRNVSLPWSLYVIRTIEIEDVHGTVRQVREFQAQCNGAFSPPGMSVLRDGDSIEGVLRLAGTDGEEDERPTISGASSLKARIIVSIPYYDLTEKTRPYSQRKSLGMANLSSAWTPVPANWARQSSFIAAIDKMPGSVTPPATQNQETAPIAKRSAAPRRASFRQQRLRRV